jgi:hypothetical protein
MSTTAEPQLAMDEKPLDSSALEAALDTREQKKVVKRKVSKEFRDADNIVKGLVAEFKLGTGEVARCGKYRIEVKTVPGGPRAFETSDSTRLIISADKTQLEIGE